MSNDLDADLVRMYEIAYTAERCHNELKSRLFSGQITVLYHPQRGQEFISAASGVNLQPDDYMVNIYRGLADCIAKGVRLEPLLGELLGKATGTNAGRGGPMHISDVQSGVMTTTGVVGGGLPLANGLALASKMTGSGRVTVCNFGDGAVNIGAFHEALTLASVWKLPIVFLCQNNQYGEHTTLANHLPIDRVADKAAGYGMPGIHVDGNNPREIHAAMKTAIDHARAGEGPTLVDAVTFRLAGHYVFDDCSYMPPGLLEEAIANDPLPRLRGELISDGLRSEEELARTETAIEAEVMAALEAAMAAEHPDPAELLDHVYAQEAAL